MAIVRPAVRRGWIRVVYWPVSLELASVSWRAFAPVRKGVPGLSKASLGFDRPAASIHTVRVCACLSNPTVYAHAAAGQLGIGSQVQTFYPGSASLLPAQLAARASPVRSC